VFARIPFGDMLKEQNENTNMKEEFYFTVTATESEHDFVEYSYVRKGAVMFDLDVVYYRKFKNGHVPMQRECKLRGTRSNLARFKNWNSGLPIPVVFENYWKTHERF
jgi:hypothetical protein